MDVLVNVRAQAYSALSPAEAADLAAAAVGESPRGGPPRPTPSPVEAMDAVEDLMARAGRARTGEFEAPVDM